MNVPDNEQNNEATVDFAHISSLDFHLFPGDSISEGTLAELVSKKNVLYIGNRECPDKIESCLHKVVAFLERNSIDE